MKAKAYVTLTTTIITLAALLAGRAYAQETIYYESFSGSGSDPLNGKTPDVSATGASWQAGNLLFQNGHWDTLVAGTASGQAAWLPITIYDGRVYTVESVFINTQPNWLAVGFLSLYPANNSSYLWTDSAWYARHSNSGYIWSLNRNRGDQPDQQAFVGYGTGNSVGAINGDLLNPAVPIYFRATLDTMNPTAWTCSIYLSNGLAEVSWSGAVPDAIRQATQVPGGTGGIRGVGLSYERNATANAGADIDYFWVTQVPEPGTCALIGLAALGTLLHLRRRS